MNGDYTILDRSMNGIRTVTDGISIISNGIATHENVYYNEFIKSADEKTITPKRQHYYRNDKCRTLECYRHHGR